MINEIKLLASKIRLHCLEMTSKGKSSHIGSCLSCVDILAVLYKGIMKYDVSNTTLKDRDRFIMSKGHAGAAVYATIAEMGFIDLEILKTHYMNGSNLSGHVSHYNIPGVEFSTGSLGHGLSVATGIAYSLKLDKIKARSYCLLSDGELDEGSNWKAMLFASHNKLSNLCIIVDYNKIQSLDSVENTLSLEPLEDKAKAFGFDVKKINGHSIEDLLSSLNINPINNDKPTFVICDTIKGKGITFMENSVLWHYRSAQNMEYDNARKELEKEISSLKLL